jgi:glycosyltransferase involved in cell wall biosynthesis
MTLPRVSVIIPTYNNAKLLPETLDGVLRQSVKDVELILIDDGSTDSTAQIVKDGYPQIRYLYQQNRGPAAARNEGVRLAQGEFIAFCDHDDIWNESHLEALLNCFSSWPRTALAFDNAQYFGTGESDSRLHLRRDAIHLLLKGRVSPEVLLWRYPIASMSVVMTKKTLFEELGGLNEEILALDDLHFYLRVAAREEIRYVDYVGCQKRLTETNLSHQVNIKEVNVRYLEDLWQNHPEVIQAIGPLSFRLRLARKYFKLGRYHLRNENFSLARQMFWNAYKTNFFNLRYLWACRRMKNGSCDIRIV